MTEFSAIIASKPGKSSRRIIEILDVVSEFSSEVYFNMIVTVLLSIVMLSFQIIQNDCLTKYLYNYLKRMKISTWTIYCLIIDQASFSHKVHSIRILWIFVAFASFALIHGFVMNLVSTDLIAEIQPPRIHTIDDLLTPHFELVGVNILPGSPEFAALRDAPIKSSLNTLFRNKVTNYALNKSRTMQESLGSLISGKEVIILTTEAWTNVYRVLICCFKPAEHMDLLVSQAFVSNTLLSLFSEGVDQELKSYIERRVMTVFEFNVIMHDVKQLAIEGFKNIGFDYNWNVMRCDKNLLDRIEPNLPLLHISTLHSTFLLGCCIAIISFIVLVIENLIKSSRKLCKRKFGCKPVVQVKPVRVKPKEAWTKKSSISVWFHAKFRVL